MKLYTFSIKWLLTPKIESATAKLKETHSLKRLWILEHSGDRAQTYDLRVMSPNADTADICEKLIFLHGFRICGSNQPEELRLTTGSITKQRIVVNHLHTDSLTQDCRRVDTQDIKFSAESKALDICISLPHHIFRFENSCHNMGKIAENIPA